MGRTKQTARKSGKPSRTRAHGSMSVAALTPTSPDSASMSPPPSNRGPPYREKGYVITGGRSASGYPCMVGCQTIYFQKPRLLRNQKVFSLNEAPILLGQKIILHRPVDSSREFSTIDYHRPATITRVKRPEWKHERTEVRVLCQTKRGLCEDAVFELDTESLNSFSKECSDEDDDEDDEEDDEVAFPFSIDQSSPAVVPYKPHETCRDVDSKELVFDIWQFWTKLRNRIYKKVSGDAQRSYEKHFYRSEALEEFKKLFPPVMACFYSFFLEMETAFHPMDEQTRFADLMEKTEEAYRLGATKALKIICAEE
jgi:hypothetical protein